MGKKKRNRSTTTPTTPEPEKINLRTAPPVVRMRGQITIMSDKLAPIAEKLADWSTKSPDNELLTEVGEQLATTVSNIETVISVLTKLEKSGFLPPRKSYTLSTDEGDVVSVLEDYRVKYVDIVPADDQVGLTVVKKYPGKGGGLVVQTKKGVKMKVATSHILKTS
jgi:hypothetical protein